MENRYSSNTKLIISLHENTKLATKAIAQKEWDLILILQQVIEHKVYLEYNYPNLSKYLILSHGLAEDRAYDYSTVARATLKFKKLQVAIEQGRISVAKARRIAPVLNNENQEEWITKARLNTHRRLEKLVASKNPEVSWGESVKHVSANQIEIRITMTEMEYQDLKRVQDLLCQKRKKQVSLRSMVLHTAKAYLEKEDPVVKAMKSEERELKRQKGERKKENKTETNVAQTSGTCRKRRRIPMPIFHQVQIRDKGQCQETLPNGEKCQESKWIDIHHIKPIHQGGANALENLVTLCNGHHKLEHWVQN